MRPKGRPRRAGREQSKSQTTEIKKPKQKLNTNHDRFNEDYGYDCFLLLALTPARGLIVCCSVDLPHPPTHTTPANDRTTATQTTKPTRQAKQQNNDQDNTSNSTTANKHNKHSNNDSNHKNTATPYFRTAWYTVFSRQNEMASQERTREPKAKTSKRQHPQT